MNDILHMNLDDLPGKHTSLHEGYEYTRRRVVPRGAAEDTLVSVYEVPASKAAYPYHYHMKDEETFFILRGEGTLKTPKGEKTVRAGDFLFFPAGSGGAHKLTNTGSETLVYIDFDSIHDLDVCVYPDSGKIGVWGKDVNRVYPMDADVDYYHGE
ncbi:MAG: cupin domain-containing protein [Clostridia bacterium]|nr:cupin domain-containing protein [Clostridia bacterium]